MTLRRKDQCHEVSLDNDDGMIFDRVVTAKDLEKQLAGDKPMLDTNTQPQTRLYHGLTVNVIEELTEYALIQRGENQFVVPTGDLQPPERERMKLVRGEVAHLRTRIRRPLELHEPEDYSCQETAQMIGVSVSAAKSPFPR